MELRKLIDYVKDIGRQGAHKMTDGPGVSTLAIHRNKVLRSESVMLPMLRPVRRVRPSLFWDSGTLGDC